MRYRVFLCFIIIAEGGRELSKKKKKEWRADTAYVDRVLWSPWFTTSLCAVALLSTLQLLRPRHALILNSSLLLWPALLFEGPSGHLLHTPFAILEAFWI